MLTLTRKEGEAIHIGEDVIIRISSVRGKSVRISIEAPHDWKIQRDEHVFADKKREQQ